MRTLVHLSDLHFGLADRTLRGPLLEAVHALRPDLAVVSGDLTEHAQEDEFREAREFLDALPGHCMVVPGNHDMSFYNWYRRVTEGLALYRRHITDDMEPFYRDDEIAVLGLNTARVTNIRGGRIRPEQVARVEERFGALDGSLTKVLVTHHPFDFQPALHPRHLIGGARDALRRLVGCVDLLLAGHMHLSHTGYTAVRYRIEGRSAVFAQAGTAMSRRNKGEANAFNVIQLHPRRIEIVRQEWDATVPGYRPWEASRYQASDKGWVAVEGVSAGESAGE